MFDLSYFDLEAGIFHLGFGVTEGLGILNIVHSPVLRVLEDGPLLMGPCLVVKGFLEVQLSLSFLICVLEQFFLLFQGVDLGLIACSDAVLPVP